MTRDVPADGIRRSGPRLGRLIGQVIAHVIWSTRVEGARNVPRSGAVILAANHTGFLDGPVLAGASPRGPHILVKQEMYRGFVGRVLRATGQIPVDRRMGRAALTTSLALLAEGRVVGIFPEGTRGEGDVTSAEAGVAWLAVRSGATVVPVAIFGTRPPGGHPDSMPRPRTRFRVVFGESFRPGESVQGTGRAALAEAMGLIQRRLADHVTQARSSRDDS